jgi:hypothetical protein
VRVVVFIALGLLASLMTTATAPSALASEPHALNGIRVLGNRLVTGDGQPVRLIGVNRSGAEYACIRGWGMFDGPADVASIQVIRSWHANAVRVGLNEDCWLGINGVPDAYGGVNYQRAVIDFVTRLTANGMYAIVDLHWSAPGRAPATSLREMPDEDHSVDFWRSVATSFADDPNVVFDLFNEPFGVDWDCWRDGCTYPGGRDTGPWQAVGMQSLVDTIRATGASQPILLGGLAFANDMSAWRSHTPDDPLGQLVASFHVYPFNACNQSTCWDDDIAPLAESVPVVIGEVGTDWTPPYSDRMAGELMQWADDHQLGYLAWAWNTSGTGDALLTNYLGESTTWGTDFKAHVAQIAIPRLRLLRDADAAYAAHDLQAAVQLYEQTAVSPPSDDETEAISAAIDGVAHWREVIGMAATGDEAGARGRLALLVERHSGAPLARLASQFWDQYTMTGSPRAACAQLAPQVETQASGVLNTLTSVGVPIRHDELCVVP